MRYLTYLLSAILINFGLHAQPVQWKARFGGKHAEYLDDGLFTVDYGFMMVGGSLSSGTGDVKTGFGGFDGFVVKIDEDGQKEWTRQWGGSGFDRIRCIANTQDGGYLLAVESDSPVSGNKKLPNIGQKDVWLVKIDITGHEQWQRVLGGPADDIPVAVLRTADGGYVVGVRSVSDAVAVDDSLRHVQGLILKSTPHYGNEDFWIVKLDANANLQWEQTLGGRYDDMLTGLAELPGGNIIAGGFSNSPVSGNKSTENIGENDWWTVKLSADGDVLMQKNFGTEANDELYAVRSTQDGKVVLGGFFSTDKAVERGKTDTDFVLLQLDKDLNLRWKRRYNQAAKDILTDVVINRNGTMLLGGYATAVALRLGGKTLSKATNAVQSGNEDYLVIKTDKNGKEKWHRNYGGPGHEVLRRVLELRDGGYILMGTSTPPASKRNDADFFLVKVADKDKKVRPKLPLEAIPNPAGDYTRIVLGKKYRKGHVRIADLHGNLLQEFDIDGSRIIPVAMPYPPGIYIIGVEADDMYNSIKVIKR